MKMRWWLVGGAVAATVMVGGCRAAEPEAQPTPSQEASTPQQQVKGQFHIYPNEWFRTIPDTTWNRCDGEPECDGEECYGVQAADGLGFGTKVLVTNADGKKVGLDEIDSTWGWQRGPDRGSCVMYWSVDVPETEAGVLTATFDDNPDWAVDFTLKEMKKAPHSLDFIGLGDVNE